MRGLQASFAPSLLLTTSVFLLLSLTCSTSEAQDQSAQAAPIAAGAHSLITEAVDEHRLAVLRGNTHPLARPEFDLGTAAASLPLQRMLLVLKRSAEQEVGLRQRLDDQQDKASPNYHKWLTPTEFGKQFGPSDADVQTITAWLQSHGFQVSPTKGRTVIEFSGSASQVKETFHAAIHKYMVNGEEHWANSSDPQIPAALTPAVAGVFSLHNFRKKPQLHMSKLKAAAQQRPGKPPELTFGDGTHALAPQDYSILYNINPSYNNGINGQGITIGIIGRSNLFNGGEDIGEFRFDAFGLCCGNFNIVLNGPDPGDLGGGEEGEATLDTSWAGAIAPNATVDLVVSASTDTTDGIDLSEVYIIENNLADVMSESFGTCEYFSTSAEATGISALAEQAAAQGITYLVSTGDNGAEGCDDPNSEVTAGFPVSASVLASTPFNVAVGGTIFNENGKDSLYWNPSSQQLNSVLSYIPEDVWNESCLASSCGANAGIWAGSGGFSTFFSKPSWQSGVTGIPTDIARDLPDVSLTAASHDPYLLCLEASCLPDATGEFFIYFVWGTSASAPSFAGVMALVDQQMGILNPTQGPRQGAANYVLYRLAASQNTNWSQCNGSGATLPASTCIFNDVTVGNNAVPGELNYGFPSAQFQSGVGYDLATGLGSVNVFNLVSQWNSITFNSTITTLGLNPVTNITHGQPVNVNIGVAPSTGTGTPTGDTSLITGPAPGFLPQTGVDFFPLSNGAVATTSGKLPGGTYTVWAHYAGDATYAPSDSTPVSVTVSPEPSTTTVKVLTADANGIPIPFTSGPFGSFVYLRADVVGQSGLGFATGTVTFADSFGPIPGSSAFQLNSEGNTATPNGIFTFDTGSHTISASYAGDGSFMSSTSAPATAFTITPGFFFSLGIPQSAPVYISAAGLAAIVPISEFASTGFGSAVTFSCGGLPLESACTFSPASVTGNAQITLTLTTTAAHVSQRFDRHPNSLASLLTAGGFALCGVLLVGARKQRRYSVFFSVIVLAILMLVTACGGGSKSGGASHQDPGTPAGTYNIVVTATGGSIVQNSGFTLTIQ